MQQRFALPSLTALALVLPACSQLLMAAAPAVTNDPAKVPAGTYSVEPMHTEVTFGVLHMGFTYFSGMFSGASGSLALTPNQPRAMAVSISVPVDSVYTPSARLNGELKAADWLDAAHYPTMVFRSTSVTSTGKTTADVAGMLTLHGVTKPLTLHATFVGAGVGMMSRHETAGFALTGMLKRSDFGVTKFLPLIGDDVSLTIAAAFEKT